MKKSYYLILLMMSALVSNRLSAQCTGFYDGFESGVFTTPWVMGTGAYTMSVPSTSPAVGTYNLNMTSLSSNSFYEGPRALFPVSTPNYISWRCRTNTTTGANGYFVIGDGNVATNNGILFAYFNGTSQLRFFANTGYNYPITANTWYHVECYLNWTNRTMDIYINNTLVLTAWPFRSTTSTNVDRVLMHSLVASSADYDEIIIGTAPVTATSTSNSVSCFGANDGSATVSATGGNGIYTYSWAPSGGTSATATGLSAGTYTCTVTDGTGCTGAASVTITEPADIALSAVPTNVSCNGFADGSINLTISGGTPGYTQIWSNGDISEDPVNMTSGLYNVYVEDANGCRDTLFSVVITEPPALQATVGTTGILCNGDTGSVSANVTGGTPGYSYAWSSGGSAASESGLVAGTYSVTITDAAGCVTTSTVVLTEPPPIGIVLGGTTSACQGDSVIVNSTTSGGTPGYSYMWMPGNSTNVDLNDVIFVTTTYTLTVTDANGCSSTANTFIAVNSLPVVALGADISICDNSVVLDAQNPGASYLWSSGSTTQTDTILNSGIYSVQVTDANGCTGTDTIVVNINQSPIVTLGGDTATCGGGILLDAGHPGSSFVWNDNSTAQTLLATATGTYFVTVTDANGCFGSDTINVTLNAPPVASGTASSTAVCLDDANVTLTGSPVGGNWSGPGVTGNSFDPSVGVGAQTVSYTYTDNNGCEDITTVVINVNACVGYEESFALAGISVYPNPNNGMFAIAFDAAIGDVFIQVIDIQGRAVMQINENNVQPGYVKYITLENMSAGLYTVRIVSAQAVHAVKLIVQQ